MTSENEPFISIIFPNWNGMEDSLECINSLRNLEYPKDRLEIIIADNGSTDESQNAISQLFKKMRNEGWNNLILIKNKYNLGPTYARIQCIRAAYEKYNYLWMMDNDIIVDKGAIKEMLKVSELDSYIGIVGSLNYYFDRPTKISPSGGYLSWSKGRIKFEQFIELKFNNSNVFYVDYVYGSSFIIKKKTVRDIGLLNHIYFWGFNEIDWCIRAKKAGYKVCIAYNSKIWHKISHAIRQVSGFKLYFKTRNIIIFVKNNYSILKYVQFIIYLLAIQIPRNIYFLSLKNKISKIRFLFKGLKDGLFSRMSFKFN